MNELRSESDRSGERRSPDAIGHDLAALRSFSTAGQADLETSLRAARRAAGEPEGFAMVLRFLKTRPALATALGVLVVAAGLLVIPISYERTVGYDVALTLDGANVAQPQVREIAKGFKETLGAEGATVEASMENGRLTYVLHASSARDVRGSADAFAKQLVALGYTATVSATPRRETVSTNVYAYAMSQVIQISTDGKSASQLESEIRDRLLAAGVSQAQVSVKDVGDNGREVRIEASQTEQAGGTHPEIPELVLTKNGQPIQGGDAIRVMKKKDGAGAVTLSVSATVDGKSATVEIPNADTMSDAAVAAEIRSKLLAAGIDAVVTVNGEQITVEKREK